MNPAEAIPGNGPEPGDRFELARVDGRLVLPKDLGPSGFAVASVVDASGRPVAIDDPVGGRLALRAGDRFVGDSPATPWLECLAPGRFRLAVAPGAEVPAGGEVVTEQGIRIACDPGDLALVREGDGRGAGLRELDLAMRATGWRPTPASTA